MAAPRLRRLRRPDSRKEARANQRWRLLEAVGQVAGRRGYAETSVAQIIDVAGVSRKAFYEHFTDREDCFLAAYVALSERLVAALVEEGAAVAGAARTRAQLGRYLEVLEADRALARAFILEVLAAGPKALRLREQVNQRFSELVFAHTSSDPLVRKAIAGGVNDVVAGALLEGRRALPSLLPSLIRFSLGR